MAGWVCCRLRLRTLLRRPLGRTRAGDRCYGLFRARTAALRWRHEPGTGACATGAARLGRPRGVRAGGKPTRRMPMTATTVTLQGIARTPENGRGHGRRPKGERTHGPITTQTGTRLLSNAKAYRANNQARIARYQRQWREKNREAVEAYERHYRETHREQRRADFQRWRSRLHGAEGTFTASEFVGLCEAHQWRCVYCGVESRALTADHLLPLSRGGSNAVENIAPACKSCNSSKGAKTPGEFAEYLARLE